MVILYILVLVMYYNSIVSIVLTVPFIELNLNLLVLQTSIENFYHKHDVFGTCIVIKQKYDIILL